MKPRTGRKDSSNDKLYVRSTQSEKSFYLNLFIWSGTQVQEQNSFPQGIESQFLIDTGASISILNFETFKEIQRIQKHVKILTCTKKVLAANEQPINMMGMADIECSYDADNTFPVTHRFWIYGSGQGKQNLLGMDFINKECTSMNFTLNHMHHKRYPGKVTQLRSTPNKDWPFTTQLYPICLSMNHVIEPLSMQLVKLPKPTMLKFIPKHAEFYPSVKSIDTKLFFLESVTTENNSTAFPTVVENATTHPIAWNKGKVGHIGVCLARRYEEKQTMFNAHNYSAFVGAITEFGKIWDKPLNHVEPDPIQVNMCSDNKTIASTEFLQTQDHDYAVESRSN